MSEVRDASGAGVAGDGRPGAHTAVAARAQAAAAERAHGPAAHAEPPPAYAGLVTRAIAFAVDSAIVNLTGIAVGVVVGLALSILEVPDKVDKALVAIGGVLFVVCTVAYFVAFWSTTGQTPGNRLMRIRVRRAQSDEPLRPRWALVRLVGLFLAVGCGSCETWREDSFDADTLERYDRKLSEDERRMAAAAERLHRYWSMAESEA